MGWHRRLSLRGRLDHAQGRLLDVAPATGARGLGLGERHASAMRPTVQVVGPGRIGREVARFAEAFGARTMFAGRGDDLDALLADADIVSVNCPSTAETHHLFDAARFARMKPTAVLVNTARGPIVDE